jgi:ABC-2 type transport system permease protein
MNHPHLTMAGLMRLEWRRLRRDLSFWAAIALGCLMLWYGLANGAAFIRFQQGAIEKTRIITQEKRAHAKAAAEHSNAERGAEIGPFHDPHSATPFESRFLPLYDCLPPGPLAMIAVGQSDLLPVCIRVTAGPLSVYSANYEWENPLHLLLGRFDCAFAVLYLLPLLAFVISFNLLSRERELGTLPLVLASPVPLTRWLGACFLLRGLIFLGAVLFALVAGLFVVGFDLFAPGAALRLALFLALVTAYLVFWFALAFAINARGLSSAANALGLVGLWLMIVMIIPASLNLGVKRAFPLPSRVDFLNDLRQASDDNSRKTGEAGKSFLHDHPELAFGNIATEPGNDPFNQRFIAQNARQQVMIECLRFMSPAIVFQQGTNELAGNDQARHRRFMAAVETHRAKVKAFFQTGFMADADFAAVPPFEFREDALDHHDFGLNPSKVMVLDSKSLARDAGGNPAAKFPHPALSVTVQTAFIGVALLIVPALALCGLGLFALRRPGAEQRQVQGRSDTP